MTKQRNRYSADFKANQSSDDLEEAGSLQRLPGKLVIQPPKTKR